MAQVDEDALAKIVWILLGVVLLPFALIVGLMLTVLWLWRHWPTWWLVVPVGGVGIWVLAVTDPVGDYLAVYRGLWSTVEAGRPLAGVGERWSEWVRAMAPLSAAIGTAGAAAVVTYFNHR